MHARLKIKMGSITRWGGGGGATVCVCVQEVVETMQQEMATGPC